MIVGWGRNIHTCIYIYWGRKRRGRFAIYKTIFHLLAENNNLLVDFSQNRNLLAHHKTSNCFIVDKYFMT